MTAVPPSPGHRGPAARHQKMPRAAASVSKAQVTHVLSHIRHGSTHAGKHWGRTRPPAATEATGVQMPPCHGPVEPQHRFLLWLFTYKAPRKQTLWFVQIEMWHLLIKELGRNHAKALAHSSFLKRCPRKPTQISLGFYRVLSSSGH